MESRVDPVIGEELSSPDWWIGLAGWVLQDGNYTDFKTGERRQFALEFGYARTKRLERPATEPATQCRYSGRTARYSVAGQLLRAATGPGKDAFVLGNIKANLGYRRFTRRSLPAVQSEWRLMCTVHNLLKLQQAAPA